MDQQIYAMKIADIFNIEVKKKIISGINKKIVSVFPAPDTLYLKDIVKKNDIQTNASNTSSNINNDNPNITQIATNQISSNNNSQSFVSKKKYYEEDNYSKNKKGGNKFQYREMVISSNADIYSNYGKVNEDVDKSKLEISFTKSNNLENDNINNETTSTSSKEENFLKQTDLNKKDENLKEFIDILKFDSEKNNSLILKSLYSCKESSRFNFVSNRNNNQTNCYENINVPDFVFDLIKKKTSIHKLTKKIEFSEDILYKDSILEKEYNNSNPWAEFIMENKKIDRESELTNDFDKINQSIKDKFTTFYLK